jgi:hypothetical protein
MGDLFIYGIKGGDKGIRFGDEGKGDDKGMERIGKDVKGGKRRNMGLWGF